MLQERNRIDAISAGLSSTDQLTSKPTHEFTQEKSHTSARHAVLDLCRWVLWVTVNFTDIEKTFVRLTWPICTGCSPSGSRSHSYRREAISMRNLWHSFPPSADTEKSPANTHRRKALSCKHIQSDSITVSIKCKSVHPHPKRCSHVCFTVWKMQLAFSPQKSAAVTPAAEARRNH